MYPVIEHYVVCWRCQRPFPKPSSTVRSAFERALLHGWTGAGDKWKCLKCQCKKDGRQPPKRRKKKVKKMRTNEPRGCFPPDIVENMKGNWCCPDCNATGLELPLILHETDLTTGKKVDRAICPICLSHEIYKQKRPGGDGI